MRMTPRFLRSSAMAFFASFSTQALPNEFFDKMTNTRSVAAILMSRVSDISATMCLRVRTIVEARPQFESHPRPGPTDRLRSTTYQSQQDLTASETEAQHRDEPQRGRGGYTHDKVV